MKIKPRRQKQPVLEKFADNLPLALARGIIRAHGGELEIQATQDEFGRQNHHLLIVLPHKTLAEHLT